MTTLFNICVDITEKLIKQEIITAYLPILATIVDSNDTNITETLFGIPFLSLNESYWSVTSNNLTNSLDIDFGEAVSDYSLPVKLKLTTFEGVVLATSLLNTTIEIGSGLILSSGEGISLTLNFGTSKLSNFILNAIFKGVTTYPSEFFAKYYDNGNNLRATIELTSSKWSKKGVGTLGEIFFEYGNTQTLPTINSIVNFVKITDSTNTSWFEFPISLPTNLKPNSIIYSNSLILRIPNPEVNLTVYSAPSNSSSVFYADFNGSTAEKSSNSQINSLAEINYDSELKIFGTECLICSLDTSLKYENVVFPNEFTLNCFFYFTSNPVGRSINFAEKDGVFKLAKTASNNLEVSINNSVVISQSWSPVAGQWQHIWVQKSATQLKLKVNSADINVVTPFNSVINTNSNLFSVCTNIIGLCNGIYLENGSSGNFELFSQPLPKRRYDWSDISFWEWVNLEFPQLKLYF